MAQIVLKKKINYEYQSLARSQSVNKQLKIKSRLSSSLLLRLFY